jgi:hypothetical protein
MSFNARTVSFNPFNETYSVNNPDGSQAVSLKGQDALTAGNYFANYFSPNRKVQDILIQSRPGDVRAGLQYKAKRMLQDFAESSRTTLPGRILDRGPLAGGGAGAAAGFGVGTIADLVLDKINGGHRDPVISMKWLGALLGGGVGTTLGHYRKKINSPGYNQEGRNYFDMTSALTKQAAMFHDPRNVILEKLQGASDLGFAEKAKLAAAVRSMDITRARQLADMVKASLGFGVGAIIAKYLFGMNSLRGTMFGGIVGILGTGLYNKYLK